MFGRFVGVVGAPRHTKPIMGGGVRLAAIPKHEDTVFMVLS